MVVKHFTFCCRRCCCRCCCLQVGYDVVDHPDLLLVAASSKRRGAAGAADDADVKDEMLARMRNLRR
jgi:hypothetical protein